MPLEKCWPSMDDKYKDLRKKLAKAARSKEKFPSMETLPDQSYEARLIWREMKSYHEVYLMVCGMSD